MVVLKINADTAQEREVKIVNDKGTWASGSYHLYTATSLADTEANEPHDTNRPDYLGELIVDKEKATWEYKYVKLSPHEQKEVAEFIIDYVAPDRVY